MWLMSYYIFTAISTSNAQLFKIIEDTNEINLNSCVIKLLNIIKGDDPGLDVTLTNSSYLLHKDLNRAQTFRIISRSFRWNNNIVTNKVYVISIKDTNELKGAIAYLKYDYYWNPRGIFIVNIFDAKVHLNLISHVLKHENIFNVSVIVKSETDITAYNMYGFTSDIDTCNRPKKESFKLLTSCSELDSDSVFTLRIPGKLRDCRLKMLARDSWPYIGYPDASKDGVGIDEFVLDLWKKQSNISFKIVVANKKQTLEYALQSHHYRNLTEPYDAFCGGHTLLHNKAKFLEFSYPYIVDHKIILVPQTPYLSKWKFVFNQITYVAFFLIFILFAIFCVTASLLSLFTSKIKDVSRDIIIVFGYFVNNNNVSQLNPQLSARIILLSLFIFVFLLLNIIQAFVLSASTNPIRSHQVTELREVYEKFQPVIYTRWLYRFNFTNTKKCTTIVECVSQVIDGTKKFTAISDTYYKLMSWDKLDDYGQVKIYKLPESAYFMFRVTFFQRGSTLVQPFNDHLTKVMAGGLVDHQIKKLVHYARLRSKVKTPPAYLANTLKDFKGAFVYLILGYVVSIIAFIYELKLKGA